MALSAVPVPFGHQLVTLFDYASAMFYNFPILLKQAVSPPQQLMGSMERVVQLGFEVPLGVVRSRHGVEFLYFCSYQTFDGFQGVLP